MFKLELWFLVCCRTERQLLTPSSPKGASRGGGGGVAFTTLVQAHSCHTPGAYLSQDKKAISPAIHQDNEALFFWSPARQEVCAGALLRSSTTNRLLKIH